VGTTLAVPYMDAEPTFPPVVAVVVTCDPGPWFEETLQAFAEQDYPNLSVLVVDAGSRLDPTARVAGVLPGAYVHRFESRVAFGRAANQILGIVEGASHYFFCHDDVAPDRGAVRALVEEAFRSNAAIVSPKLVDWHEPERLQAVGLGADRVGVVHPLIDPGELDQEQHDSVREVFLAPGAALLVRADMFAAIGGYDPLIEHAGEDLDLCWRAHLAGARVLVAPAARVRHLQATLTGARPDPAPSVAAMTDTNRLRTMLTCYRSGTLLRLFPLAVFYLLGEAATLAVTGHVGPAGQRIASLVRALARPVGLARARHQAQRNRRVSDRRASRLQTKGNARLQAWLAARLEGPSMGLPFSTPRRAAVSGTLGFASDDDIAWEQMVESRSRRPAAARDRGDAVIVALPTASSASSRAAMPAASMRSTMSAQSRSVAAAQPLPVPEPADIAEVATISTGGWRLPVTAGILLLAVFLIGSRTLLGNPVPDVGLLPVASGGLGHWWSAWLSTWQPAGLGSTGPSAPALGLLALGGSLFGGALGTFTHVLVLGPFVVGAIGAYRSGRWWGSQRGRVAMLVAYALVPVPYDALARGRWDGLIAYAATPWVLSVLVRLSDALPLPAVSLRRIGARVVGLGLVVALIAAFVPSYLAVVVVVGLGLALGSLLVAQVPVAVRTLGVALAGAILGFALLLPWSAHVIGSRASLFGVLPGAAERLSFSALLRLHVGPIGAGPLGWGLLLAAGLPLVIGRSWRLAWAARLWAVALLSVVWAWAGLRGWVPAPDPSVTLAPACAALAGAVGLGVVAFELDLPGYRFGWRQGASFVAALGLALMIVPVLGGIGSGSWKLPRAGASSTLSGLDRTGGPDYRILWVGAPAALPMAAKPLGGGQAFATSFDGLPDATDQWTDGRMGGAAAIKADLQLAAGGRTTRLGHLLAPLGVRYLVLPSGDAPAGSGGVAEPTPTTLLSGLLLQTDLRPIQTFAAGYTVYANAAWVPVRTTLSASGLSAARLSGPAGLRRLQVTNLSGTAGSTNPPAGLTGHSAGRATGPAPKAGTTLYVAATPSRHWQLRVGGRVERGRAAFGGVGTTFAVPSASPPAAGSRASLVATTVGSLRLAQLIFAGLWLLAGAIVIAGHWQRSRAAVPAETVDPEWFAPSGSARPRSRRSAAVSNAPVGMDSDEVWVDA